LVLNYRRYLMSVPATFSATEISAARNYVIQKLGTCKYSTKSKRVLGNPYVTYQELAHHLNYEIETYLEGDRVGVLAAGMSQLEYPLTGIMLGALVVSKAEMVPGEGFFKFARDEFGELPDGPVTSTGTRELTVWATHVNKAVQQYGK
jgi:hypothetical protein